MAENKIDTVLVGGACVAIYAKNYVSYDLDFISYENIKKIKTVLQKIGFDYDDKKYFVHPECKFFLEFLSPPVAIGDQPIFEFNTLKSTYGTIKILTPTDCVKDRLAAYFHWNDYQSLEQAISIAKNQKINLDEIKRWAKAERNVEKFQEFKIKLQG